jgi:hypothetical protein
MDSLFSILGNKNFDEPPEVAAIKKFVRDSFHADVIVLIRDKDIVITVPSAAFANALRLRSSEMKRRCQIEKRVIFRIG